LTYAQTAEWLNVSKRTVERLVKRGDLVPVRVGAEPRLEPADVRTYLAASRRSNPRGPRARPARAVGIASRSTSFADRVRSPR
jgi:excisionase family DNA binding protein